MSLLASRHIWITGAFLLAAAQPAYATRHYPKAIKDAMDSGAKVMATFPAASGLTGWVLAQNGTYTVAYTTADKKTLIVGSLFNEKGENLTDRYAEQHFPKPDRSALFGQLELSTYVTEGTARNPKSVLYVFADATNPNCYYLWKALQPYARAGLQMRWIPVSTLSPSSMPRAIEILEKADIETALRKDDENAGEVRPQARGSSESGNTEAANRIRKNNMMLRNFGISGMPVLVWKDRGGKVQVKSGMPRLSEIPNMTGLPRQEIHDEELAKFR